MNLIQKPLTMEQVAKLAPSAFASQAHESRSSRYTYIPTVNIIEGMMKAGFQPFKAVQSRTRIEGKKEFTKHMIRFRTGLERTNQSASNHASRYIRALFCHGPKTSDTFSSRD